MGMLVLSRRLHETLVIDGNIRITVLGINGNQVRIGVDAPRQITVHREEIQKRVDAEGDNRERAA